MRGFPDVEVAGLLDQFRPANLAFTETVQSLAVIAVCQSLMDRDLSRYAGCFVQQSGG
jgi:hypothetical protein